VSRILRTTTWQFPRRQSALLRQPWSAL